MYKGSINKIMAIFQQIVMLRINKSDGQQDAADIDHFKSATRTFDISFDS